MEDLDGSGAKQPRCLTLSRFITCERNHSHVYLVDVVDILKRFETPQHRKSSSHVLLIKGQDVKAHPSSSSTVPSQLNGTVCDL